MYLSAKERKDANKAMAFIKKEAISYRKQAEKIKAKGVNLDKLEKLSREHVQKCIDYSKSIGIGMTGNYQLYSYVGSEARKAMQEVDDNLFGCFIGGRCVGYSYY